MKEHHLEDACLEWLANAGWAIAEGEAVAPSSEMGVRERWSGVVLAPRLREATIRINPDSRLSPSLCGAGFKRGDTSSRRGVRFITCACHWCLRGRPWLGVVAPLRSVASVRLTPSNSFKPTPLRYSA
ncbi:hypothetical protein [Thermomonas fusca]